ncbi:hypothetical protein NLM33_17610 [Bradyrhizobium sp. CCGUVB1N3]|uniref:hypothetical protein n=1 Tax=Bradyrhizobium sp. CCGUVB1N3 TaxID=2949629 RepID=UPI0020B31231|nr:hypothetical protein [Bradyrhizobium sp. CCGUVB1N3]MCP3472133.1 hypothetical protein [Bradyrhizobium sp. CCGUVB1N3]
MIQSLKPAPVSTPILLAAALLAGAATAIATDASAAPTAEAARKCMHYSYIAYPYQRPGSVRMSPDRQTYFRDCMAKDGNVPEPPAPKPAPASADVHAPKS